MKIKALNIFKKHLQSTLLVGTSLLSLNSCESLPYTPFTYLFNSPELMCSAIEMNEDVFDIVKTKGKEGWYTLTFNSLIELDEEMVTSIGPSNVLSDYPIYINPKKRELFVSNPSDTVFYSMLEENSCQRTFRQKVRNPYAVDVGSSIELFNLTKPSLEIKNEAPQFFIGKKSNWKMRLDPSNIKELSKKVEISDKEVLERVDWETIQNYNLKAYEIWEKHSQAYTDEELRRMYFNDKIEAFMELKKDIKNFLSSASFKTTFNKRAVSHYHPIFSQIIIDLYINFDNNSILENMVEASNFRRDDRPLDELPMTLKGKVDRIIGNEKKSVKNFNSDDIYYSMTNRFANLAVLMQTLSYENCYEWGLRPEITRFLLPYRLSGMKAFINNSDYNGSYVDEKYERHITNSLFSACGDISEVGYLKIYKGKRNSTVRGAYPNYSLFSPYIVNDHEDIIEDALDRAIE